MYKKLLDKILEYNKIVIFRHARPDGDCTFSQLALYEFLKDNFKDKTIKLAGFEKFDLKSKIERVSDSFIKDSLAIVLDTATLERIDDNRCKLAKFIIKIDHHPSVQNYGDINIVSPESSATCELLADIFFSNSFKKFKLSNKVCEYLYCGMVTDTLNFKTANTTAHTLLNASKLVEKGSLKPSDLVEFLMNDSLDLYNKVSQIRNYLKINNNFGYILLKEKDLKKINIDPIEAKNKIDVIGSIKELNIWAFAVEVNGKYDCSIRSKRKYVVNNIATKYRGGGHPNACAVKQVTYKELQEIFLELSKKS